MSSEGAPIDDTVAPPSLDPLGGARRAPRPPAVAATAMMSGTPAVTGHATVGNAISDGGTPKVPVGVGEMAQGFAAGLLLAVALAVCGCVIRILVTIVYQTLLALLGMRGSLLNLWPQVREPACAIAPCHAWDWRLFAHDALLGGTIGFGFALAFGALNWAVQKLDEIKG